MKKIIFLLLSLLVAQSAFADTCATALMPVFTSNQAQKLCKSFGTAINGDMVPAVNNAYDLGRPIPLRWRSLYLAGDINLNAASTKIYAGTTSVVFRNNADNADNVIVADAGTLTARSNVISTSGDLITSASGKTISIQEATASSACMGAATPNGTTPVTVTTSCALTGSRVFFTRAGAITNMGTISTTTAPNNTSFAFASTGASDTLASSVIYLIVKESA